MSVQKQLNSFLQAHRERKTDTSHDIYNELISGLSLDYRLGISDDDLNSCMKELTSIVHSPDFGCVVVVCDDSDYELISDFEEI